MSIKLKIPLQLQKYSCDKAELCCSPAGGKISLKHLFETIEKEHPGLKKAVFGRDGKPLRFLSIFVNGKDYRNLKGGFTELVEGDIVTVTTAIVEE
ncbi:MAG: molybdopterin synthase sulfur carrier subunit [Candidatus Firestonebacteria bacterium]